MNKTIDGQICQFRNQVCRKQGKCSLDLPSLIAEEMKEYGRDNAEEVVRYNWSILSRFCNNRGAKNARTMASKTMPQM